MNSLWQHKSFTANSFNNYSSLSVFRYSLGSLRKVTIGTVAAENPALNYRLPLGFLWFVMHRHCLGKFIVISPCGQDLVIFTTSSPYTSSVLAWEGLNESFF